MTDGIGRLTGYGNYGVNGFTPHKKQRENASETNPGDLVNYDEWLQ